MKPPFFPPFTAPKKRARESPQGGGGPRVLFFMEDADPARSGVDPSGGRIPPSVGTLSPRLSLPKCPFLLPPLYSPFTPPPLPPLYPSLPSTLPAPPPVSLHPPPVPPPPPCQSPLRLLLLLARLLLLRLFNRIVLASDSCGVGNKIQNAKQQTRRNLYIGQP